MSRVCACGCGESLDGRRKDVRYVSVAHKQRGYRKHLASDLEAAGLPAHLNRSVIPTTDPPAKRSRSGLQVSYRKAARVISELDLAPRDKIKVRLALLGCLPPRQLARWRDQIEGR